ncbi:MAG: hypothetical protein B6I30_10175 [Desulfobacteraceae bacterium 4572_187]|nr:MAG: hypothetical protein B6I30_10175 [Desulfobacteraceae bacterium 4572_187]
MKQITTLLLLSIFVCSFAVAENSEITSSRAVEEFFKTNSDLRISSDAVESYKTDLNEISLEVITRGAELAKEDNRKTLLERDITQATEEIFRKAPMTVTELMEKIKLLSIINLAELSNQVKAYSKDLLEKRK